MQNYEIDILKNNQWKLLRYCSSIREVCTTVKAVRSKQQCKLRVLENNNVLEFINDDNYSLFYFIQKYEHYEDMQSMLRNQKILGRYYKLVGDDE